MWRIRRHQRGAKVLRWCCQGHLITLVAYTHQGCCHTWGFTIPPPARYAWKSLASLQGRSPTIQAYTPPGFAASAPPILRRSETRVWWVPAIPSASTVWDGMWRCMEPSSSVLWAAAGMPTTRSGRLRSTCRGLSSLGHPINEVGFINGKGGFN